MNVPYSERTFFPRGVNMYVPKMTGAANLRNSAPVPFSLGTPAAVVSNGILTATAANTTAGTETSLTAVAAMDSPYGRTITFGISGDPGNSHVVDVYGYDYLNQPMVERFTGASGATATLYGKKAFKWFQKAKIVTASSNAVNFTIGTGYRLGLPYKGDISYASENGVLVPLQKRDFDLQTTWSDADTTAGGSQYVRSPCAGYVSQLFGFMGTGGSTTNAATTVELGNTAITGLTITLDQDTVGDNATDTPTTVGYNANNRLVAGSLIEIVHAATTAGGIMTLGVKITPTQFTLPDTTDPQTLTTGDPRGTYEANLTYDGAKEIVVAMMGDGSFNSSGNGGLHGIRHVVA